VTVAHPEQTESQERRVDVSARREAVTLMIGALMLFASAVTVAEAHERALQTPVVSVSEAR
jgi:hypothetical protein